MCIRDRFWNIYITYFWELFFSSCYNSESVIFTSVEYDNHVKTLGVVGSKIISIILKNRANAGLLVISRY